MLCGGQVESAPHSPGVLETQFYLECRYSNKYRIYLKSLLNYDKTALVFVVICLGERGHGHTTSLVDTDLNYSYSWHRDFDGVLQKVTENQDSDIKEA